MAVWSEVSPMTASHLSPLPGFEYRPRQVRKLPVTWQWFSLGTPVSSTTYSWLVRTCNMAEKVTKNKFQIPNNLFQCKKGTVVFILVLSAKL